MSNVTNNKDEDWDYLSGVLAGSNSDEDLIDEAEVTEPTSKAPKTGLEAQIQNLTSPDAALTSISGMRPGKIHIHGKFTQASGKYIRTGLHITEAIITDDTGSARVVWFNQPYKARYIKRDIIYELRGTFGLYRSRFQINNAQIRLLSEGCAPFERQSPKK
jgi:hypothetical protein